MPFVKMKSIYAGPRATAHAGQLLECSKVEAQTLIEGRYAEPYTGKAPARVSELSEEEAEAQVVGAQQSWAKPKGK